MKNISLMRCFLTMLILAFVVNGCFAQSTENIPDDEYEVFSAYIDQVYLALHNDWYTIRGEKGKIFNHLNKIEQVVIRSKTVSMADSKFDKASYFSQVPKELFVSFTKQNKESYQLTDKFKTKVEHHLFWRNYEETQFAAQEMIRRNADHDVVFYEKYPKSVGFLNFFRPVFDFSRKNALLGVISSDIYTRQSITRRGPSENLVLLSKENNQWIVKKVFSEDYGIKVDLKQCQPVSKGAWLPLGSNSFKVLGIEKGKCHISEFNEIEGGYTQIDCFIPTTSGEISVMGGNHFIYSKNLSTYCRKPKTGNIFFDRLKQDK